MLSPASSTRMTQLRQGDFSPEVELLFACSRVVLDSGSEKRIRQHLERDIRWDHLVETAAKQRVLPLLERQLRNTAPQHVPDQFLEALFQYVQRTTARNQFLSRALRDVVGLLQAEGIRPIPYKGLLLAATVYGNLGLRQVGDLDLLVGSSEYARARSLLTAHAYRPVPELDMDWESTFLSQDDRIGVDLHQALLPRWFGVRIDFDELWERRSAVEIAGVPVSSLSSEDGLIVLCLQLFKDVAHDRLVLRQACDIAETLRVHTKLDWHQLWNQAAGWGIQRQLCVGLWVTREALGTEIPDIAYALINSERSLKTFARRAVERMFARHGTRRVVLQILHEHRCIARCRSGLGGKLQAILFGVMRLVRMSTIPTDKERVLVPLPDFLSFLYYLIRPIRLSTKWLFLKPALHLLNALKSAAGKTAPILQKLL